MALGKFDTKPDSDGQVWTILPGDSKLWGDTNQWFYEHGFAFREDQVENYRKALLALEADVVLFGQGQNCLHDAAPYDIIQNRFFMSEGDASVYSMETGTMPMNPNTTLARLRGRREDSSALEDWKVHKKGETDLEDAWEMTTKIETSWSTVEKASRDQWLCLKQFDRFFLTELIQTITLIITF